MSSNIGNEIRSYIALGGWTLQNLVKGMNDNRPLEEHTTPQNISNKLSRGTLKYSEAREIANVMGFKIEWTKR